VEPVVVFTTSSDIEASVVTALLDSQGISAFRITGNPQAIWPLAVNPLGEIRVAVAADDAEAARRVIDSHREDVGSRVVRIRDEFEDLQDRIEYHFKDRGLLEHALTHKSRAAEDASGGVFDNESLEFLGDAVLGLVVADALFHRFPEHSEGQKSKIKAAVVSTASLADHAERIGLGSHLLLGRGEEKTGGRFKQALLADSYEALIAAIYLDGGLAEASRFLNRELSDAIDAGSRQEVVGSDYKSALQERLQALGRPLPEYRVSGEAGPDHRKVFTVEVAVGGAVLGTASGRAKKEAEQEAARLALATLADESQRSKFEGQKHSDRS
jgi:ribonuclease-3